MSLSSRLLFIASIAVAVVTGFTAPRVEAGKPSKPIVVGPARFTNLPGGWRAFDHDFGRLTGRGADVSSYALSWSYEPGPFGWANTMPPGAIAVNVILIRRAPSKARLNLCANAPHLHGYPKIRRLPLRLPRTTTDRLEGQPRVPEYRVFGRMDDSYNVDLRVDINTPHPDASTLRTAQAVVSAIRFPPWPRLQSC
jgi:hypothetical protein